MSPKLDQNIINKLISAVADSCVYNGHQNDSSPYPAWQSMDRTSQNGHLPRWRGAKHTLPSICLPTDLQRWEQSYY